MSGCQTRSPWRGRKTRRKSTLMAAQCRISKAPSAADVDDQSDASKSATTMHALKHRRRVVVGLPRIRMMLMTMMTETMTTMAAAARPRAAARPAANPL